MFPTQIVAASALIVSAVMGMPAPGTDKCAPYALLIGTALQKCDIKLDGSNAVMKTEQAKCYCTPENLKQVYQSQLDCDGAIRIINGGDIAKKEGILDQCARGGFKLEDSEIPKTKDTGSAEQKTESTVETKKTDDGNAVATITAATNTESKIVKTSTTSSSARTLVSIVTVSILFSLFV
jgi:hypothetical protein